MTRTSKPSSPAHPWAVAWLAAASLALTSPTMAGECYKLTHTDSSGKATSVREGKPLSPAQQAGIQAGIDMIQDWVSKCGVTPPGGGGGGRAQGAGDQLQQMLDDGNICAEVAADPSQVGATASNPQTGNGSDGKGGNWSTSGHPGINVTDEQIPKPDPNGSYSSGGQTYDAAKVASLAGQLLHELSHIANPAQNPASPGDYEAPAYTYAAQQLCKVAGCSAVSKEVKETACKAIRDANQKLCEFCKPQVDCKACADMGIKVKVKCPKCNPPPPQPTDSPASALAAAGPGGGMVPVSVVPLGPGSTLTQLYAGDDYTGTLSLHPKSAVLSFDVFSEHTSFDFDLDLDDFPALDFEPQDFVQLASYRILVGGHDRSTGLGEMVEVIYDPALAMVQSVSTVFQGNGFGGVLDMATWDFSAKLTVVLFLDETYHSLLAYTPWSPTTLLLATTADAPGLAKVDQLTSRHVFGGAAPGYVVVASTTDEVGLGQPMLIGNFTIIADFDLDGVLDTVY